MSHRQAFFILVAASVLSGGTANGQTAGAPPSDPHVNVYQFAIDNPVSDSPLTRVPTLGETVPASISLVPLDDPATYAYFYYNGQPIIVDLRTRSVVRIGD